MDPYLDELERVFNVPFVFWLCPNKCRGYVKWNQDSTVATCEKCGHQSNKSPGSKEGQDGEDSRPE